MTKKVGIAEILQAKKIFEETRQEGFYSTVFGGEIEVEDVPPQKILEIVNGSDKEDPLRANYELIYACCPVFRGTDVLAEFEVQDPVMVVEKAFCGNIVEVDNLAKHILKRYGYYGDVQAVKKP